MKSLGHLEYFLTNLAAQVLYSSKRIRLAYQTPDRILTGLLTFHIHRIFSGFVIQLRASDLAPSYTCLFVLMPRVFSSACDLVM
jgi:hypothetical protein